MLTPDADSRMYLVEVHLFGARNDRTVGAAAWRVQRLAKTARLEMYVRRCDLLETDREVLTEWRVHTVAHRPEPRPPQEAQGLAARLRWRWNVFLARVGERRGRHDIGTLVSGTASEAGRLSRMDMQTGASPRSDVDVRAVYGRERSYIVGRREEAALRHAYQIVGWLVAMDFCAVLANHHSGYQAWFWGLLAVGSFAGALWDGSRTFVSGGRVLSVFIVCFAALLLLTAVLGWGQADAATPLQMLFCIAVLFTVIGIWLLVRQWTWGEWLAWAAPLVLTAVFSFVVASGSVLHALYANMLGLDLGDLDVPGLWQATAAVKLLGFLSLALFVPAAWGIAKHRHVSYIRPGEELNVPLYLLAQVMVLGVVAVLAVESADHAATAVKSAADNGKSAPPYFGVQPEWICAQPTVPRSKLNVQGHELHSERPYLSFGVSGDYAVLWDSEAAEPFKVPAGQLRLLPAKSPRAAC
ncbi:NnrS multi-domain protein [Streptomyces aquilus]|uniref:NnrS multi-domain protein n=1 Tax=Streptomyces aquilus TaxID=2548456 RepID=UPI001FCB1D8C|nr:NnrS multi-domain protein [Streptomyces aquilus]